MDMKKELAQCIKKSEIKNGINTILDEIKQTEIDSSETRFLFIIGIRENGGVYFQSHGEISELEAEGLRTMADDSIDELIEHISNENGVR